MSEREPRTERMELRLRPDMRYAIEKARGRLSRNGFVELAVQQKLDLDLIDDWSRAVGEERVGEFDSVCPCCLAASFRHLDAARGNVSRKVIFGRWVKGAVPGVEPVRTNGNGSSPVTAG